MQEIDWYNFGLGALIKFLEKYPEDKTVPMGFNNPHSWRGDYSELAFEPKMNTTVGEMLSAAKSALGTIYQGYKGGDFKMHEYTTCHIAYYGESGNQEIGHLLMLYMMGELFRHGDLIGIIESTGKYDVVGRKW